MDDRDFFRRITQPPPEPRGTRIRLVSMPNDPAPIEPGTEGTVEGGNGGQLWVKWDNGRALMLAVGVDTYEVIGREEDE